MRIETSPAHGTAVCAHGRGFFLVGPSGSGKSATALAMMALGAGLVADDQVLLTAASNGTVTMAAPAAIAGQIEARYLGILAADTAAAPLNFVVDLGTRPPARLPTPAEAVVLQCRMPLIYARDVAHLAPGLIQMARAGRIS